MEKIKAIIITDIESRKYEIRNLFQDEDIAIVGYSTCSLSALEKIMGLTCHVVLIDYESCSDKALELSLEIYHKIHHCFVFFLVNRLDANTLEKAMSVGVKKVLVQDNEVDLIDSLKKVVATERSRKNMVSISPMQSKVISVFSGSGGIGKTTLAVNLGVALAKKGKKVLLMDLSLQFGNSSLFLDLESKDGIAEIVQENTTITIETIKSYCITHSSGLSLLNPTKSPEYADYIKPKHIGTILSLARPYYDYILIDCQSALNDIVLEALSNSDRILMILEQGMTALKNAKLSMGIFETLHLDEKVDIVVNKVQKASISLADIEKVIQLKAFGQIPFDLETTLTALNRGTPAITLNSKSKVSQAIVSLAEKI